MQGLCSKGLRGLVPAAGRLGGAALRTAIIRPVCACVFVAAAPIISLTALQLRAYCRRWTSAPLKTGPQRRFAEPSVCPVSQGLVGCVHPGGCFCWRGLWHNCRTLFAPCWQGARSPCRQARRIGGRNEERLQQEMNVPGSLVSAQEPLQCVQNMQVSNKP